MVSIVSIVLSPGRTSGNSRPGQGRSFFTSDNAAAAQHCEPVLANLQTARPTWPIGWPAGGVARLPAAPFCCSAGRPAGRPINWKKKKKKKRCYHLRALLCPRAAQRARRASVNNNKRRAAAESIKRRRRANQATKAPPPPPRASLNFTHRRAATMVLLWRRRRRRRRARGSGTCTVCRLIAAFWRNPRAADARARERASRVASFARSPVRPLAWPAGSGQ